nr:MAG TPA: hypothetical protein [Caudoviricetes sp.]
MEVHTMNTIKHLEYTYNGRRVILDTCELAYKF